MMEWPFDCYNDCNINENKGWCCGAASNSTKMLNRETLEKKNTAKATT